MIFDLMDVKIATSNIS